MLTVGARPDHPVADAARQLGHPAAARSDMDRRHSSGSVWMRAFWTV